MIPFASEEDYKEYLGGRKAVITAAFAFYSRQASQLIKQYTFDNIDESNISDEVKMCCCELAEMIYSDERSEQKNGGISSESVQGWSRSYEDTESRKTALKNAQRNCIYKWLGNSGLLFSGVRRC